MVAGHEQQRRAAVAPLLASHARALPRGSGGGGEASRWVASLRRWERHHAVQCRERECAVEKVAMCTDAAAAGQCTGERRPQSMGRPDFFSPVFGAASTWLFCKCEKIKPACRILMEMEECVRRTAALLIQLLESQYRLKSLL
ncbi:hypothetical protein SETIT_4G157400v2 [Setaria italica]|uniref:Uncharacterized protein n=1 Tax=Setaria italica TaxID=4555 RepID=A0A368QUQ5_SETIT|nr:hypothetical protein SETIT_4G157400v2 [Setaria italica]